VTLDAARPAAGEDETRVVDDEHPDAGGRRRRRPRSNSIVTCQRMVIT
jgi:hypothetical protein